MSQEIGNSSVIQAELSVVGQMTTNGDISVSGRVDGGITGKTVEVLESAAVRGELKADHAVLYGFVKGHVRARTVTIGDKATVEGELQYNTIEIASGARIEAQFVPVAAVHEPSPDTTRPPENRKPTPNRLKRVLQKQGRSAGGEKQN